MADVITQFKLETTQYYSKLRDASKGLKDIVDVAKNASSSFTGFSQKSVEAARALGTVASGATTAKDKVRDLVGSYNDAVNAYNKLTEQQRNSPFGKALAESLTQLQGRIKEAKQELYGLGDAMEDVKGKSSGLFGEGGLTGMLQVAGGNLIAQGITAIGSAMADTVQQGIELARQGEGIRAAFERLNKPGLLDNLREATHGTVADLDLMAQAVKFDNFGLSLEQMGTMLAFAQQQAKDTGQSVDYMVDSIVTGLGRKSLPILDNLGLSAAEIRERMKESGDMTKAVADIIKERMEAAGGYVETAADRAARAAATAKNEMENLGREAIPVAEEWAQTWATLTQGAMKFANTLLGPVARSIRSIQGILNGDQSFEARLERAMQEIEEENRKAQNDKKPTWGDVPVVTAPGGYVEITDKNGKVIAGKHFDDLAGVDAWRTGLGNTTRRTGGGRTTVSTEKMLADTLAKALNRVDATAIKDAQAKMDSQPSAAWQMVYDQYRKDNPIMDEETRKAALKETKDREREAGKETLKQQKKEKGKEKDAVEVADQMVGGINNMVSSLEGLGIEIPQGFKDMLGGLQSIVGVLQSIMMIVQAIQAIGEVGTFLGLFKNGGIVPHAATGMIIPGNDYSDRTPVLAQSGELILNRAQQGNLAAQLQVNGIQGMQLTATVRGEDIRLALNNNGRRTGRGEYVQSTKRR